MCHVGFREPLAFGCLLERNANVPLVRIVSRGGASKGTA